MTQVNHTRRSGIHVAIPQPGAQLARLGLAGRHYLPRMQPPGKRRLSLHISQCPCSRRMLITGSTVAFTCAGSQARNPRACRWPGSVGLLRMQLLEAPSVPARQAE